LAKLDAPAFREPLDAVLSGGQVRPAKKAETSLRTPKPALAKPPPENPMASYPERQTFTSPDFPGLKIRGRKIFKH